MPEMTVATCTANLGPRHARKRFVYRLHDGGLGDRASKRWPATTRIELIGCCEERFARYCIHIDAIFKQVVIGMRKGALGCSLLSDGKRGRVEHCFQQSICRL